MSDSLSAEFDYSSDDSSWSFDGEPESESGSLARLSGHRALSILAANKTLLIGYAVKRHFPGQWERKVESQRIVLHTTVIVLSMTSTAIRKTCPSARS